MSGFRAEDVYNKEAVVRTLQECMAAIVILTKDPGDLIKFTEAEEAIRTLDDLVYYFNDAATSDIDDIEVTYDADDNGFTQQLL